MKNAKPVRDRDYKRKTYSVSYFKTKIKRLVSSHQARPIPPLIVSQFVSFAGFVWVRKNWKQVRKFGTSVETKTTHKVTKMRIYGKARLDTFSVSIRGHGKN